MCLGVDCSELIFLHMQYTFSVYDFKSFFFSLGQFSWRSIFREFPGDPVIKDLLLLLRTQVLSLVGKLGSCKLGGVAKKNPKTVVSILVFVLYCFSFLLWGPPSMTILSTTFFSSLLKSLSYFLFDTKLFHFTFYLYKTSF